jgi:hypothetical protein
MVTSETTFSLKPIYLMKMEDEMGMRGACVAIMINKSHSDHTSEIGDRLDRMMYTIESLKIKKKKMRFRKDAVVPFQE